VPQTVIEPRLPIESAVTDIAAVQCTYQDSTIVAGTYTASSTAVITARLCQKLLTSATADRSMNCSNSQSTLMMTLDDRKALSLPASDVADSEQGLVQGRRRRRKRRRTRSVVSYADDAIT